MDFDDNNRTMEKQLTCAICGDVFTDPLVLPCGHGFCKACLESNTTGQMVTIRCKICETSHNCDITKLKCDTVLASIATNWKKWNAEIQPNKASRPCDICEESTKLMNCLSCLKCRMVYCLKCKNEYHPPLGVLAEHKIEPLVSTTAMESESCSLHNKDFVYFCRKCVKPACSEKPCYEQHKDHQMEMLPKVYKDERDTANGIVEKAKKKVAETIDQQKQLQTFLNKLKEVRKEREDGIEKAFGLARAQVEDKRKELLAEEEEIIGNRIKNVNNVINEIKSNNSSLGTLVSFAEKATEEEKKVPFLMMSSALKDQLDRYTAVEFCLSDDVSSIPAVPERIELSRLYSEIESLKAD